MTKERKQEQEYKGKQGRQRGQGPAQATPAMQTPFAYGTAYEWAGFKISNRMMWQIREYVDNRQMPGGFLYAVVRNDLLGAVTVADYENLTNLPAFVAYFYNHAPAGCWGDAKRVSEWLYGPAALRPCGPVGQDRK